VKRILALTLILFFHNLYLVASTDSLELLLKNSNNSIEKFEILSELVSQNLNTNPLKSCKYAQHQLKITKVDTQIALAYLNMGLGLDYQSKFDSAIFYYNKSLVLYSKSNHIYGQSKALLNLGVVNYYKGDLDEAVKYYFKALKFANKLNDKKGTSALYNNLGTIFREKGDFFKAKEYYEKSLAIDIKVNDSLGMASSYNNLGIAYRNLQDYDQAISYYEKSLVIKKNEGDHLGIAATLTNLGQLYFFKKDFTKGLDYNLESLAIERKYNNKLGIAQSYVNIGEGYLMTGDYNSSIHYLENGYKMAKELGVLEAMMAASEGLSEVYAATKEYQKAYSLHKDYSSIKDSFLNESANNQIAKLEAIYQNEAKKKEINILNKENQLQEVNIKNQKIQKVAIIIVLILVLMILFFIYRGLQQKKKANVKLAYQKLEIEDKNKEITDSINYAKRIQQAVLKTEENATKNFLNHFILFKPKDIVSGDFYWVLEKKKYLYISASDCTGHGVPGAFMSMLGISFLNEINAHEELLTPAEILNRLRDKIIKELGQTGKVGESRDGMDISLVRINLETNKIDWAGANNPLWVIKNSAQSSFQEFKPNKQPIGYHIKQQPFTNHTLQLEKEDRLYLFSDGYADQFGGEKGKKFMKKRFKELLIKNSNLDLVQQKEKLNTTFENWKGSLKQLDDVCVIGVKL